MDDSSEGRPYIKIVRNAVKCKACGTVIESVDRHDYKTCGCPNQTMVDGGKDYLRRGGVDLNLIEDHTEYGMPDCLCGHEWEDHHHGCVMNPAYFESPLVWRGCIAQECEATQVNGDWLVDEDKRCYCDTYQGNDIKLAQAAFKFNLERETERRTSDGNGKSKETCKADSVSTQVSRKRTNPSRVKKGNVRTKAK